MDSQHHKNSIFVEQEYSNFFYFIIRKLWNFPWIWRSIFQPMNRKSPWKIVDFLQTFYFWFMKGNFVSVVHIFCAILRENKYEATSRFWHTILIRRTIVLKNLAMKVHFYSSTSTLELFQNERKFSWYEQRRTSKVVCTCIYFRLLNLL